MIDIVTSFCVDDPVRPDSLYPQLRDVSASKRRQIYWQYTAVFLLPQYTVTSKPGNYFMLTTRKKLFGAASIFECSL